MKRSHEAIPILQRALRIREAKLGPMDDRTASSINNLAIAYRADSKYNEAIFLFRRSLLIREEVLGPYHLRTATALNNIAYLLRDMGRLDEALTHFQRALSIAERTFGKDSPNTAMDYNNIAGLYRAMGRYNDSAEMYTRALKIRQAALGPWHPDTELTISNLGVLADEINLDDIARSLLQRSLQICEKIYGPDHPRTAISLHNMAMHHLRRRENTEAINLERRALLASIQIHTKESGPAASSLNEISSFSAGLASAIHQQSGDQSIDESIFYYKMSVNARQQMRAGTNGMEEEIRMSFTSTIKDAYQELSRLLIQRGRLAEAEKVLLMLKESDLTEYLRRNGGGAASSEQLRWTREEEQLHQDLNAIAAQWRDYHQAWRAADMRRKKGEIKDDGPEFAALDEQRQKLETRNGNLLAEAQRRFQAGAQAAAKQNRDSFDAARTLLAAKLSEIRQLDGAPSPRTAGLVLLPGERGLTMMVTTEQGAVPLSVRVSEAELGKLVLDLRDALQRRGDYQAPARTLYQHLIAPAEAQLGAQAQVQQWAILPYGVLRNLPFAALLDAGGRHLIERYALVTLTADGEGGLAGLETSPKTQWRSAGLGASIADSQFGNVALPGVRTELCGVVRDAETVTDCQASPGPGLIAGRRYLDARFTDATLKRLLGPPVGTQGPTLLHIATHFNIDRSMLLLGNGDTLRLPELVAWNPKIGHYDLLVLSACDSGKAEAGVESLGGMFRKQGAKSVLATLWPVADVGAGPLMVEFYRQRGEQRAMAKSEALRLAQVAMLQGQLKNPADAKTDLRHPYFWSGYVLMGNWL